jgi:hypothetical protein
MPALGFHAVRSRRQVHWSSHVFPLVDVMYQYAEEKYGLDMTSASNLHQLNLALTRGAEKETFVFPKGPSGKVKLAPKRPKVSADTKEVHNHHLSRGSVIQPFAERQTTVQEGTLCEEGPRNQEGSHYQGQDSY